MIGMKNLRAMIFAPYNKVTHLPNAVVFYSSENDNKKTYLVATMALTFANESHLVFD